NRHAVFCLTVPKPISPGGKLPLRLRHQRLICTPMQGAQDAIPKEFATHQDITHALKATIFFATPYHAWERGLNENTNRLIRDFFPKGTDFSTITNAEVAKVERLLNARPRKSLGFRSPQEVFHSLAYS